MEIFRVERITDAIVRAFEKLIPQLDEKAQIPTKEYLEKIICSDASHLFLAKEEGEIVGTLTLVIYQIPTCRKAWFEDVVVDSTQRGKGIAKKLMEVAIDFARKEGVKKIDLTSNPSRVEAHRLYKKIGFKERTTVVFRLEE